MGRRKIEIKAIKDDRNRSVTFLKRKGGLFKKAHELSVLCSVDVAVFIFGQNKKLYEYSSGDMRELITRYTYHGGPQEHKGPQDFHGGDDEDEEDENGTPQPHGLPQQFHGQPGYGHVPLRHQTQSVSPPVPNGMMFPQRAHTPQPHPGSRPGSRNDMRRMVSNPLGPYAQGHLQGHPQVVPHGLPQGPPQGPPTNGYAYVPQQGLYNPQNAPHNMPQNHQYPHPPHHMQMHMDQRQSSVPPNFPPQNVPQQPSPPQPARHSLSPPQHRHGLPSAAPLRRPSPPPQRSQMQTDQEAMPVPMDPRSEQNDMSAPQPPPMNAVSAIKKLPQRKQASIFTPVEEDRSLLSQHMAVFEIKSEHSRVPSFDAPAVPHNTASPPQQGSEPGASSQRRQPSVSSIPDQTHTPPSRADSLRVGGPSRPRLKVQIPDEPSEAGSNTAESTSAGQHSTDATSQTTRNDGSHSSGIVLPPPSPSAANTLASAGATGPPNPFARPPLNNPSHNHSLMDTPASALPSRYMNNEFLPSPSQFFGDSYPRHHESNTLPSPLNFATPVVGFGPSFLREDLSSTKRKSPEMLSNGASDPPEPGNDHKRLKVEE